ncbi:hypothetical protein [Candidatus Deferrimicrobium sp.]|uniref:hypothetical protein n=1 Tax=Candidatus Deferrimicrobium sp. TaxID=3060586 RepID=UPI002ED04430
MRVHYVLNHGGTPASKLAERSTSKRGLLADLKLVGSVWRSKKGDAPTVLVPARSYATAGGVRYYEPLLGRRGRGVGGERGGPGGEARRPAVQGVCP